LSGQALDLVDQTVSASLVDMVRLQVEEVLEISERDIELVRDLLLDALYDGIVHLSLRVVAR
jgi:hypothetical protein